MSIEKFFISPELPFFEARYTETSKSSFAPHLHQRFSVGAVASGTVCYNVAGQENLLELGSLAIINPEAMHSCNAIGQSYRSFYMLYLDVSWCTQIQQSMWGTDDFIPANVSKLEDTALYDEYCLCMQKLLLVDIYAEEKEQLLYSLLSQIFAKCCDKEMDVPPMPFSISRLKMLLAEDLHKDMSLDNLSAQFKLNPYTLIRQFKAETGLTPHAYRMNCRIEKAREYLQEGKDIGETALECGFFDQSHLHRYFKGGTSLTPKKYQVNFIQ